MTTLRRVAIEIAEDADLAEELRGPSAVVIGSDQSLTPLLPNGQSLQVVPRVTENEIHEVSRRRPPSNRVLATQADWTALVVPIKAAGQVIGVMSLRLQQMGWSAAR